MTNTSLIISQARAALQALASLQPDAPTPRLGDLWQAYQTEHVDRRLAPSGQKIARYSWNNLRLHFGQLRADEIDQATVDSYEDLRRGGEIGHPSKTITIRRELAYLRAAINFAAKRKAISKDAVPELELPPNSPPRDKWLTIEDIQRLLNAAASMRLLDGRLTKCERFLWIAFETGARKSAILELEWSRVDLEHGTIDFRQPGKVTKNKRRGVVAISDSLRPFLERASRERIGRFVLDNPSDGIWQTMQIVANKAGFGGTPTSKGRCAKSAGVSPHVLRHSSASHMARNGVAFYNIADVLANSVQIIERVYAHHAPPDANLAVNHISSGQLSLRP